LRSSERRKKIACKRKRSVNRGDYKLAKDLSEHFDEFRKLEAIKAFRLFSFSSSQIHPQTQLKGS